jgi:hypothetical protein
MQEPWSLTATLSRMPGRALVVVLAHFAAGSAWAQDPTLVRRDDSGNLSAGTLTLAGNLALPNTGASVGSVTMGGVRFLHSFGSGNTFIGANAGNTSMIGPANTGVGFNVLVLNTTGFNNSAVGNGALTSNTTGGSNSAFGHSALANNTMGNNNSAFGLNALSSNTSGQFNAAFGGFALSSNTTGVGNSAFGNGALNLNTTGHDNSAFGANALSSSLMQGGSNSAFGNGALLSFRSGDSNTAIGAGAGANLTTGSNNIYLGNPGAIGESGVIRMGLVGSHTAAFIAGIFGATNGSGVAVFVNSAGQLGTSTSSRRLMDEIAEMGEESAVLMKLLPVAFYYKPEYDATRTRQYGLLAEEVAEVAPHLVLSDKDGTPQTVRYQFVTAMLLNEVQKQRRLAEQQKTENEEQRRTIARQQIEIQDLAARLGRLEDARTGGR